MLEQELACSAKNRKRISKEMKVKKESDEV